ncbi:MAG: TonB-dependent receptor, partial [Gammaproteobacteria bacterium]|nr:TonB-dependent receptor [Gammaproteobacteria bacterium]
ARADDELLVYVFSEGAPVEGATVTVGEAVLGQTSQDGSLFADLSGNGLRAIKVSSPEGTVTGRFSAAVGQLVDVVARLDDSSILVDVYSQSESVADRRAVAEGTLNIIVEQSGEPVADESIFIAGSGLSLVTDASGLATVTLPRGRYRMQVAEQAANFRVVGGLTRSVSVVIDEEGEAMQIAAPEIEEVFVVASFDPAGLEVSERDASNIVDTIGVELLARFSDSDVAASVVRVPGISVQDDKYVFIRGLGGRYISSTLNGATMPSTNPSKRTVPLDLFPSNFVSQLDIKKTFLPFMPGESTGGNLVINTKTFPDERTTSLSVQVGYLDGVTGETVFIDPIDGDFDFAGWDDGSRKEDISVKAVAAVLGMGRITDSDSGVSYELDARTKGELQRLAGILIKDGFDPDFESALPEGKLGASYGDLFYLDSAELGVYTAVNYSNEWSQRDSG